VPSLYYEAPKKDLSNPSSESSCDDKSERNSVAAKRGCGGHEDSRKADLIARDVVAIHDEGLDVQGDGRKNQNQHQKRNNEERHGFHNDATI
jgi:hypothetical protein